MATETDFLDRIASADPVDSSEDARDAIEATMETLGERITNGQADDLAESLPDVAAEPLRDATPGEAEEFSLATFAARVDQRTDVADETDDPIAPIDLARAVLTGVKETADETELERTRDQLPDEFDLVFDPGEPMDAGEFRTLVANDLSGLDLDPQAAIDVTLETLADRITGGQAGDLATYLPQGVREPLTGVDEDALPLSREEFGERIATRADIDRSDATELTQAVFGAIRETAAQSELEDVRAQLPDEYDQFFGE